MKQNSVRERIFLVGCPRSGTTLLQSMLAAHSHIYSFPESKFFHYLVDLNSKRSKLMLASKKARPTLFQFLEDINCPEKKQSFSKLAIFMPQYVRYFVKILDELTLQQGKDCWLEKTPLHLQRINCIERFLPQAKFIHIVRNGTDAVASLYEVTHKYPQIWGKPRSIDRCIDRWLNDVRISQHHIHKPNHLLVKYENLVANPRLELQNICRLVNISFEEKMLSDRATAAQNLIRDREKWKSTVSCTIQSKKSQKFEKLFDERQRQYISDRVSVISLDKPLGKAIANPVTDCDLF